jgi:hypothetical protein
MTKADMQAKSYSQERLQEIFLKAFERELLTTATLSYEQEMALKASIAYFKLAEAEREAIGGGKYRVGTVTSPAYGQVDLVGELEGILERFSSKEEGA